jgi:hypothetical protein
VSTIWLALDQITTMKHELVALAGKVDWGGWRPRIWLNWKWLNATRSARRSRHDRDYTDSVEQSHHD